MATDRVARDIVVRGGVQGVLFRESTRMEAERLGVTGWVRNEYDGTVAVHLEGSRAAVAELVEWLHEGPRHARVQAVEVTEVRLDARRDHAADQRTGRFEVR